jgi:hypothetical protein
MKHALFRELRVFAVYDAWGEAVWKGTFVAG